MPAVWSESTRPAIAVADTASSTGASVAPDPAAPAAPEFPQATSHASSSTQSPPTVTSAWARPIAVLSRPGTATPVASDTPSSRATDWALAPRASRVTRNAARNHFASGSMVCARQVPLVAENCQEHDVHLNSLRPATRAQDPWPQRGHSNPPGHLSDSMWSSHASSLPNLPMSSTMFAHILGREFCPAVLATDLVLPAIRVPSPLADRLAL